MANKYRRQFLYSDVAMLTMVDGEFAVGSSGSVSSVSGKSVHDVTHEATGIYKIQLKDNFNAFIGADFLLESGVTGSNVSDGSFVVDTLYQIQSAGDTDWASIGLDSGLTAAAGQAFVASGSGGSGSGIAKAVGQTGILEIEVAQDADASLQSSQSANGKGAILYIQCLDDAGALADPASGSVVNFEIMLRNSSVAF